jgi:hypothetical protein
MKDQYGSEIAEDEIYIWGHAGRSWLMWSPNSGPRAAMIDVLVIGFTPKLVRVRVVAVPPLFTEYKVGDVVLVYPYTLRAP